MAAKTPTPTLDAMHDAWYAERVERVSPARLRADESRYQRFILGTFPPTTPLTKITARGVESWIASVQDGSSPDTAGACLMVLRQIMDGAVRVGALRANPAKGIKVADLVAGYGPKHDVIPQDQLTSIIKELGVDYGPMVQLASEVGSTWAETLGLRISDVNIKNRTVLVGTIEIIEDSGTSAIRDNGPTRARTVPISSGLSAALAEYLVLHQGERTSSDGDWLFLTPERHRHPLRSNFNADYWRPALERAGVDPRAYTFHNLRHTAAARMLQSGLPIQKVSVYLGHTDVKTTKRMYGHFIPEDPKK